MTQESQRKSTSLWGFLLFQKKNLFKFGIPKRKKSYCTYQNLLGTSFNLSQKLAYLPTETFASPFFRLVFQRENVAGVKTSKILVLLFGRLTLLAPRLKTTPSCGGESKKRRQIRKK